MLERENRPHRWQIAKSDGRVIGKLLFQICGECVRSRRISGIPNAMPLTLKEHAAIRSAIKKRDADAASEAMQSHLKSALKRYLDSLAEEDSTFQLYGKS